MPDTNPTTDYPRPMGVPPRTLTYPETIGAARAMAQMFDAMAAPLTRAIEQNERELEVLREQRASEDRALAEQETYLARVISDASDATPTGSRVEIFDDNATFGLLAEFDAELRLDGYQTTIGVRRNATGRITGVAIHLSRQQPEGGR